MSKFIEMPDGQLIRKDIIIRIPPYLGVDRAGFYIDVDVNEIVVDRTYIHVRLSMDRDIASNQHSLIKNQLKS